MNRFFKVRIFLPYLWLIGAFQLLSAQEAAPQKVLFVGNSYTYFWNLPQNVAAMLESRGKSWVVRQSTAGGVNLGQHWRGEKGLATGSLIDEGDFDLVVLQDHSKRAIDFPDSLQLFGQRWGKRIQQAGAQVCMYMTWARAWDPAMQEPISKGYLQLGRDLQARVAPVGQVWQKALAAKPDLVLYDEDGSHPSPLGTYLTACVFFSILTGESPVGLPHRLITEDKDGEKLYLNIQSRETAAFCQKVAWEVCEALIQK
ncbi:MAG: hypothetical protein AAFR61_08620 [Bacteroidota bacterium]